MPDAQDSFAKWPGWHAFANVRTNKKKFSNVSMQGVYRVDVLGL